MISTFIKDKGIRISKNNFEKNTVGGVYLPNFRTYIAMKTKTIILTGV